MQRSKLFDWDELNLIRSEAIRLWTAKKPDRKERERFCDWLEFVLCYIYAYGWHDAEEVVGKVNVELNGDTETVNQEIAGKTFRDRVYEDIQTVDEILRLIDTEAHRDYNTGVYNAAKVSGRPVQKQWLTMMDDRVRDSHQFLEGVTVGIDDLFYTDDGDSALFPGGFALPENNINCRCGIALIG